MTTRVAITGATGRLGSFIAGVVEQTEGFEIVASLDSAADLSGIRGADLLVDATVPAISPTIVEYAVAHGINVIVGTSGWTNERIGALRRTITGNLDVGVTIVPNFSLGSTLATTFAKFAARYFDSIEIVEGHSASKIDSPSGTAIRTAELMAAARDGLDVVAAPHSDQRARGQTIAGIPVHSLRMHGLIAQQEVIFGGDGEVLTLRHDTFSNESYRAGIALALQYGRTARGVTVGLDALLGFDRLGIVPIPVPDVAPDAPTAPPASPTLP